MFTINKIKENAINISIIIPVYNENNINFYLEKLFKNPSYKNEEIIIVDGNYNSTIEKIKYDNVIKTSSKKGRANQMNEGARIASGDILLFLHADTILPDNAFNLIQDTCKNKNIKAGAFDLAFQNPSLPLQIISLTASLRSRLTRLPYGDQAIFIKKDIFEEIGRYKNIPLMEDVNLMQKLKKRNYKIILFKEVVLTSPRKWREKGIIFTTLRNWVLISLYLCKLNVNKLARYYK